MKNLVVKIIGVLILLISNVVAQTTVMSENFDNLSGPNITSTANTSIYNAYASSCSDDL